MAWTHNVPWMGRPKTPLSVVVGARELVHDGDAPKTTARRADRVVRDRENRGLGAATVPQRHLASVAAPSWPARSNPGGDRPRAGHHECREDRGDSHEDHA